MTEKPQDNRRRWATFIGIPFQMAATIFIGYWIGKMIDDRNQIEDKWWTIGLTLLAVLLSLYQLIMQVKRLDKNK